MSYRLFDFLCLDCGEEKSELVEIIDLPTGLEIVEEVSCECGAKMVRSYKTMNFQFSPKYHSNMPHRKKVELEFTDVDGKHHVKDLTHKINYDEFRHSKFKGDE